MERRRRDKINNWIVQLSKIIPDCSMESTKSGQVTEGPGRQPAGAGSGVRKWASGCTQHVFSSLPEALPGETRCSCRDCKPGVLHLHPHPAGALLQSKGGILSKACDYIQELRQSNHRLSEELQGLDQLQLDNDVLRQQVRLPPSL